jgi:hypothetical protein
MVRLLAALFASALALTACSTGPDITSDVSQATESSTPTNITPVIEQHLVENGFVQEYTRGNVTVIMGRDGGPETIQIAYPEGVLNCSTDSVATGVFIRMVNNLLGMSYAEASQLC